MRNRTSSILLSCTLSLAGACTGAEDAPHEGTIASPFTCNPAVPSCNYNAASTGDGRIFHDMDLAPVPVANSGGLRITGAKWQGLTVTLKVADDLDKLVAHDAAGQIIPDAILPGLVITLSDELDRKSYLTLESMGRIDFWIQHTPGEANPGEGIPGVPIAATTYQFMVTSELFPAKRPFPLCKGENIPASEGWGARVYDALIFRGDRYAPDTAEITTGIDSWINIACAGTAIAKMHLLRHTLAGSEGPFATTRDQRQAMLRMLRADYCGDGMAYTVDGHPLRYADEWGWHHASIDLSQASQRSLVEGVWSHKGAVCLDRPRMVQRSEIRCTRPIPACPPNLTRWSELGHVVSVNMP
jgi:hypothetical protein